MELQIAREACHILAKLHPFEGVRGNPTDMDDVLG